jgi:hypothetical protein
MSAFPFTPACPKIRFVLAAVRSHTRSIWDGHRYAKPSAFLCLRRDGETALHWAVIHGHLPAVLALIHAGASLNIKTSREWRNDERYNTCAFWGGRRGRLLRLGWASAAADAAVARRKWTPLHWAVVRGRADLTAALLGAGADASIKDCIGYALLHARTHTTHTHMCECPLVRVVCVCVCACLYV